MSSAGARRCLATAIVRSALAAPSAAIQANIVDASRGRCRLGNSLSSTALRPVGTAAPASKPHPSTRRGASVSTVRVRSRAANRRAKPAPLRVAKTVQLPSAAQTRQSNGKRRNPPLLTTRATPTGSQMAPQTMPTISALRSRRSIAVIRSVCPPNATAKLQSIPIRVAAKPQRINSDALAASAPVRPQTGDERNNEKRPRYQACPQRA